MALWQRGDPWHGDAEADELEDRHRVCALAALWLVAYLVFPYDFRIGFLWSTLLAALTLSAWLIRSLLWRSLQRGPFGRRRFATVLVLVSGLMTIPACVAISGRSDPQDACRIGQASPEQYQTLAAEIAALPPINWDAALAAERQADGVAAALHERLEQLLSVRTSMDEQVAAMHALTRPSLAGQIEDQEMV